MARYGHVDEAGKGYSDICRYRGKGNNYWGLCPFHKDKNPSFCVTPHLGIYKCFSCGEAGDTLKFIMKTRNIEFKDLIIELAEKFGLEVPQSHKSASGSSRELKEQMATATMVAAEFYHDLLIRAKDSNADIALKYLTKRGIGTDIIKKFHIGIAPKTYTTLYDELRKDFSNDVLEKSGLICGIFLRLIASINKNSSLPPSKIGRAHV